MDIRKRFYTLTRWVGGFSSSGVTTFPCRVASQVATQCHFIPRGTKGCHGCYEVPRSATKRQTVQLCATGDTGCRRCLKPQHPALGLPWISAPPHTPTPCIPIVTCAFAARLVRKPKIVAWRLQRRRKTCRKGAAAFWAQEICIWNCYGFKAAVSIALSYKGILQSRNNRRRRCGANFPNESLPL